MPLDLAFAVDASYPQLVAVFGQYESGLLDYKVTNSVLLVSGTLDAKTSSSTRFTLLT